jgi:hypothetical protein
MTNNSKAAPMVMGTLGSTSPVADVPNGTAVGIDVAVAVAVGVKVGMGAAVDADAKVCAIVGVGVGVCVGRTGVDARVGAARTSAVFGVTMSE